METVYYTWLNGLYILLISFHWTSIQYKKIISFVHNYSQFIQKCKKFLYPACQLYAMQQYSDSAVKSQLKGCGCQVISYVGGKWVMQ